MNEKNVESMIRLLGIFSEEIQSLKAWRLSVECEKKAKEAAEKENADEIDTLAEFENEDDGKIDTLKEFQKYIAERRERENRKARELEELRKMMM